MSQFKSQAKTIWKKMIVKSVTFGWKNFSRWFLCKNNSSVSAASFLSLIKTYLKLPDSSYLIRETQFVFFSQTICEEILQSFIMFLLAKKIFPSLDQSYDIVLVVLKQTTCWKWRISIQFNGINNESLISKLHNANK